MVILKQASLVIIYQKENTYYTCIACVTIDSVLKMSKRNYPQVYLKECKCKVKKDTYTKIYKHWIRNRFWVRCRDRFRVKHNNGRLMIEFKY